jgi:hypothetical protein
MRAGVKSPALSSFYRIKQPRNMLLIADEDLCGIEIVKQEADDRLGAESRRQVDEDVSAEVGDDGKFVRHAEEGDARGEAVASIDEIDMLMIRDPQDRRRKSEPPGTG